jgi:spermidine dehydrogenase
MALRRVLGLPSRCCYPSSRYQRGGTNITISRRDFLNGTAIAIGAGLAPIHPGVAQQLADDPRDQARLARLRLLEKPFKAYEDDIRDQRQRILGPAGFDHVQDIEAITVNRWSHGYCSTYDPLIDGGEDEHDKRVDIGRARKQRISIGLSDSGRDAYAHVAIDEAYRAVSEQIAL